MRFLLLLTASAALMTGSFALAQTPAAKPDAAPSAKTDSSPKAAIASQPLWKDLSSAEQKALSPLTANWDGMSVGQKRKWQSVAKDFDKLSPAEQGKIHARMTQWSALSPQQRAAARINFAENKQVTDGLTPEQRKAQWQAYQQLSPEQKRKLAESAPNASITGAAPATKPQPVLKKEPSPEFGTATSLAKSQSRPQAPAPGKKIVVAPHVVAQGAILPGSTASPAAAIAPSKP